MNHVSTDKNDTRLWWLLCLPALLLSGVIRATFLAGWGDGFYFGPDSEGYWKGVYSVFHQGGFDIASKRSWGYPLLQLLSPFGPLSPGFTGALLQHFIGWLAILPLAAIVRRLIPEWRWFLVPITLVYALDPLLAFWEHIMIADSLLVTLSLMIGWTALTYWQKPQWKLLALILGLIFFSMSARPVGRAFWVGMLPIILLAPSLPWKARALHLLAALLFIFPAISLTKVKQGDDLLFGSVFPFIPTTGGPHAEFKPEIAPLIEAGRANLWQFVRVGQKEVFTLTLGKNPEREIGPRFTALMRDRNAFAKVRRDLAREAIFAHPFGCFQIVLLKTYSVFANDVKDLRIRPERFRNIHAKFLDESQARIAPDFPAWYLRDNRATTPAGIRTVLAERVQPGPLGQFYSRIFPWLEEHYQLYHLPATAVFPAPTAFLPLILFLIGIGGWFLLRCGSGLVPLLLLNSTYLGLTYTVGRAVQRYRLPSEYFFILGIFLGLLVIWRLGQRFLPASLLRRFTPALVHRVFYFVVGGLVSYLLNLLPYTLLTGLFHWTHAPAYAVSLSFVTLLMFFWNYRVNFPTTQHWKACAPRYLSAIVLAWTANFLLVGLLKNHLPVAGAIFLVGFLIALCKFVLYHYWVFPHRPPAILPSQPS